jgi:hypothetical protein
MEWILPVEFMVTGIAMYFGLYASVRKNHRDLMFHLSRVLPLAAAILGYIVLFRLDGVPSILALKQSIEFAINPLNGLESLSQTTHVLVRISVFVNQILFYLLFILTVRYFAFWKITIAWANRLWLFIKDPKTPAVYLFTDFNKDQIRPYLRRVLGTFDLTVIASYGAVQSTDEGKEMLLTVRNMRIRAIQEDYSVHTLLRLMSLRNAKFISLFQHDDDNIVFAKTALEALEKKLKFPMSRHPKLKANETKRLDRILNRYAFFIHYHDAHRYDAFNIESFSMGAVRLVHPDAMNTLHFLVEHPITRITPHLALDQKANRAVHVIGCDAAGSMMLREMMEAYQLPTSHQIDYTVVGANAKTIVDEILFSAALHEVSPEINPYPMREQISVHALPMDLNASLQTTVGIGTYVQNNVMPILASLDQLSFFVSYGDDLANLRIAKDLQRSLSLSYTDFGTKLKNDNSRCVLFVTIRSHELVEQEIKHNDIDEPSRFVKVEDAIAAKEMFPIVFIGFEGYLHTLLGHPYQDHLVVSRNINFVYSNSDFYQNQMTSEAQIKILPNQKISQASMMEWMTRPPKKNGLFTYQIPSLPVEKHNRLRILPV